MATNFTGVWRANLAHSSFVGPHPAALKMKIAHTGQELRQAKLITRDDGSEQKADFRCPTDGTSGMSLLNGAPVDALARWQGEELLVETWVASGVTKAYFCDCWALSPDGQTLIMEHRNDALAGQRVVLEKVV